MPQCMRCLRAAPDAPLDFAPTALQPLIRHHGMTDRRRWESALFPKVRDEIQAGNLAIDAANRPRSRTNTLSGVRSTNLEHLRGPRTTLAVSDNDPAPDKLLREPVGIPVPRSPFSVRQPVRTPSGNRRSPHPWLTPSPLLR